MNDRFFDPACVPLLQRALSVQDDEVHLWPFKLRADDTTLRTCERTLSASERVRAERFAFEKDKHRYAIAHGVLRHLLSLYTGIPCRELQFEHSSSGKPRLFFEGKPCSSAGIAGCDIAFNLSHSHDRALIGVCRGRELGVDLEMVRQEIDVLSLAKSCFFGTEIEAIRMATGEKQRETFFRYWVAKEAVLKAEGIGLGYSLDRFEVRFQAEDPSAGHISSLDITQLRDDWTIRAMWLAEGWPCAVALRGVRWSARVCSATGEAFPQMV